MNPPPPPLGAHLAPLKASASLAGVKYEIRGPLARRAAELEKGGAEIIKLNIGNPAPFGFRMPESMRKAIIENLPAAEGYCHQKGIFPAREAVVTRMQSQGVQGVTADDVFIGNGVSELITMALRGLLNAGDEVLLPSPDYPLWTAATVLASGKPVHYPCKPEDGWVPKVETLRGLITKRTRAIVVISPNNPTGAVYPRAVMEGIARLAEEHQLVVFSDEIYDQMCYDGVQHVPMASLVTKTLCGTFNGLSKVYRACGIRVGWLAFSGEREHAREYLLALDLLASLRLCANAPGQWAVQTALGGYQSIVELVSPGGRLFQSRAALERSIKRSKYLMATIPRGAMYAFVGVDLKKLPNFDDQRFAMDLLERKQVLIAPGRSFNVPYANHFRVTLLPDEQTLEMVFTRIEELLDEYAAAATATGRATRRATRG